MNPADVILGAALPDTERGAKIPTIAEPATFVPGIASKSPAAGCAVPAGAVPVARFAAPPTSRAENVMVELVAKFVYVEADSAGTAAQVAVAGAPAEVT